MRSHFRKALGQTISVTVEKFFITALLMITVFTFSSCAKSGRSSPENAPNTQTFETNEEIESAIEDYTVTCKGPCPESHGALLIRDDLKLMSCSFSLVGKDIILTNRHCLPDSLAKSGTSCKGKISAVFARDQKSNEAFDCKTVLSVPEEYSERTNAQTRDFAFLQLARSPLRKAVPIDTTGVTDGEILTAIVATPDLKTQPPSSKMESFQCKSHMNSAIDFTYTNERNTTVLLRNCPILHGHSGSALVDKQGALKAIAQATAVDTKRPKPDTRTFSGRHDQVAQEGLFALASNAACFDNTELGLSSIKNRCSFESETYDVDPKQSGLDDNTELQFAESKLQELNAKSEVLQFKLEAKDATPEIYHKTGERLRYIQKPVCLQGGKTAGSAEDLPEKTTIELTTLQISYVVEINKDARYSYKRMIEKQTSRFLIPTREVATGSKGPFLIVETIGKSQATYRLPFCRTR